MSQHHIEDADAVVKADDTQTEIPIPTNQDYSLLKFTAAEVEGERCPKIVRDLGKQIAAHLDKADKYADKAEQHRISAGELLKRVNDLCDPAAVDVVLKKFCPNLGRSRIHELKSIATGKKTLNDVRAATRDRVSRHRAKQGSSVTGPVTDSTAESTTEEEDSSTAQHRAAMARIAESADPDAAESANKVNGTGDHNDHDNPGGEDHTDHPAHDQKIAPPAAAIPTKPKTKKSLLDAWLDDPEEREVIRDHVLKEYFAQASGADVLNRIPAAKLDAFVANLLDALGVNGVRVRMSDEFGAELRRKMAAPEEVKKSARRSAAKSKKPWRRSITLKANSTREERGNRSRH